MSLITRPALAVVGLTACALTLLAPGTAHATPAPPIATEHQGHATDVLTYGDKIHPQNGYNSWNGGYLDTNGHATGNKYGVSTASTPARAPGTGTWEILSATGKPAGADVISGDTVHLHNLYGGDGGYLDTNGHATAPNKYEVTTSSVKDRATGTGRWRVFAESSTPNDSKVREGDVLRFLNGYDDWKGGFLDTAHAGPAGGLYEVSTSDYSDRSSGQGVPGTGTWKATKTTL
ncbi:hypothetical protein [Streptosporangium longisporum]|uniref:Uncharacterized protein n=1 Tax=Streptosporangium longisporum TaxID=46187 RepID=A0ABN3Y3L9_9ACTN